MNPDRSWMYNRHLHGYLNPEFVTGLDSFIEFACSNPSEMDGDKIRCPCDRCKHSFFRDANEVKLHIQKRGFAPDYYIWNRHGEIDDYLSSHQNPNFSSYDESYEPHNSFCPNDNPWPDQFYNSAEASTINVVGSSQNVDNEEHQNYNPYMELVRNAAGHDYETPSLEEEVPNPSAQKWYDMLRAAEEPLYDGCETFYQLGITGRMLSAKSEHNMSEGLYDEMCDIIKTALPEGNIMPDSFYSTKKLVAALGLPHEKIHCCINGCMLFWGDDISLRNCKFCSEGRFKDISKEDSRRRKEVPVMVMYYFPITERLQRLYASKATASHMRWHAEHETEDGVMIHPSDSEAWKHFDLKHPGFASQSRNVRLGLCTDGFAPFGPTGKQYSSWPVILTPYNLPPGMCLKTATMFLTVIIPGPRNPKQKLDVFLQPLIEELNNLWYEGATTWDISTKTNFEIHAALMWTISDFPAYSMLSGWSTAGKLACPVCMDDSQAFQLVKGGKTSWFDTHRKFLPKNHFYREDTNNFRKDTRCSRVNKTMRTGAEILKHIDSIGLMKVTEVGWEIRNNKVAARHPGCGYKKRSIFWDLPYWKDNLIRHNLDVMHIEKNVFDNFFNTVMNVEGKSKDTIKARLDMETICRRPKLAVKDPRTGKYRKAVYQLDQNKKTLVCDWARNLKFPDGFVSKLARCVDMSKKKMFGMKSHDCHVFLQRLIPIAFRGLLPPAEWRALTELSLFFRKLTSTTLKVDDMRELESQIVLIICNLEKIFPPALFDSMEHLPIHLPYEARVAGPVQYRWMYPFERFLGHLKKKIGNKDRVEASICNSYIVEESSNFCSYYFEPTVQCRRRKVPRNDAGPMPEMVDGEVGIFTHPGRPFGRRRSRYFKDNEKLVAHTYILLNCPAVKPYIKIFIKQVEEENPGVTPTAVDKYLDQIFAAWFSKFVEDNEMPSQVLVDLAYGPYNEVKTYPGYYVNGFKFQTVAYGGSSSTTNNGVWCRGDNYSDTTGDYYGRLTEILILEYRGLPIKRPVLFKCDWVDPTTGTRVHPDYKLVEINPTNPLRSYEPFIMASQATQVYFVPYPSVCRSDWFAVCHTKARSIVEVFATTTNTTSNTEKNLTAPDAFQDDNTNVCTITFGNPSDSTANIPLHDPKGLTIDLTFEESHEPDSPEVDTSSEEELEDQYDSD